MDVQISFAVKQSANSIVFVLCIALVKSLLVASETGLIEIMLYFIHVDTGNG